jgi:hypothetical protein
MGGTIMPVKWKQVWVSDECYESCGVFDVNNDGILDIVSGAWWYQGPDFKKKHHLGDVMPAGEYYDDFSTIPMDVNGDGWLDFVTGGWFGEALRWMENPGAKGGKWPAHVIAKTGNIETTRAWDIDGDGQLEIVPNTPNIHGVSVFKLRRDAAGKGLGEFDQHKIFEWVEDRSQQHGLGCGDIAGNGRMDIVLRYGWLEAPPDPYQGKWIWRQDFDLGVGSVPILVVDVNGDGLNDLILGHAHPFGLDWWEQKMVAGRRSWIKHPIDPFNAQYHDMRWADIDGDGQCELITGKRHRAHCGNEPGEFDDYGIYYFKWNGESFSKQVINYGPLGVGKGCGIYFDLADLRGTGRLDLVAPGKDGLSIFYNEGA